MSYRITSMTSSRLMLDNLSAAQRRLVDAQDRISSGKELRRASLSPTGTLSAMDHRRQLARDQQYRRNASDAQGWFTAADTALTGAVERATEVRTLVLQAKNATSDQTARDAIAAQISAAREAVFQIANTTFLGRPVFGGNANVSAAYTATATYQGDNGQVHRPVGPSVTVRVNRTGPEAFGADHPVPVNGNLMQVLDALAAAVTAGDQAAMDAGLAALDARIDGLQTVQVELGARAQQLETVLQRADVVDLQRRTALAELEDTDMAAAIIEVRSREFAYQSALGVTGRVMNLSLLDYLR